MFQCRRTNKSPACLEKRAKMSEMMNRDSEDDSAQGTDSALSSASWYFYSLVPFPLNWSDNFCLLRFLPVIVWELWWRGRRAAQKERGRWSQRGALLPVGCWEGAQSEDWVSCWARHKRHVQRRAACSCSSFLPALQVNTDSCVTFKGINWSWQPKHQPPSFFSSGSMSMESLPLLPPASPAATAAQDAAASSPESLTSPPSPIMTPQSPVRMRRARPPVVPSTSLALRTTRGSSTWPWPRPASQGSSATTSTAPTVPSSRWASGAAPVPPSTPLLTIWPLTTPHKLCTTAITMATWLSGASTHCSLIRAGEGVFSVIWLRAESDFNWCWCHCAILPDCWCSAHSYENACPDTAEGQRPATRIEKLKDEKKYKEPPVSVFCSNRQDSHSGYSECNYWNLFHHNDRLFYCLFILYFNSWSSVNIIFVKKKKEEERKEKGKNKK